MPRVSPRASCRYYPLKLTFPCLGDNKLFIYSDRDIRKQESTLPSQAHLNNHYFRTHSVFRISHEAKLVSYERLRYALTSRPSESTPQTHEPGRIHARSVLAEMREPNLLYLARCYSSSVTVREIPRNYAAWSTLAGRERVIAAPPAGFSESLAVPPCALITASTKASPRPCPCDCFPLTKRSNARLLMSGGNPGPLSSTTTIADPSSDRSRIVIWHPSGK